MTLFLAHVDFCTKPNIHIGACQFDYLAVMCILVRTNLTI